MLRYLAKRLFAGLVTILVTTVAVTLLIHLVPGDPVRIMYAQSQGTTPEQLEAIRKNLGLDRPIYEQYAMFMGRILQGDFGKTIRGQQPVLDLLLIRLPYTLALAAASLVIAVIVGVGLGFLAAYKRGTWVDSAAMGISILGISIPQFWIGLILLTVFAVNLGWLPVAGKSWQSIILPAVTLGISNAAILARLTRASCLEILDQDFIRTANSKGLTKTVVMYRHALRTVLIPIVSMLGLQFAYMMGGAIVVENVFAWNGVGRLAIEAIFQRDYPLIQGFILVFACVVVSISILVDVLYTYLDPRIRYS